MKVNTLFCSVVGYCVACAALLEPASSAASESYGEMERWLYLKPGTSPMEAAARRIAFQEGDFGKPSATAASLDGNWSVRPQDGRAIPAKVPCSIYTALWKAPVASFRRDCPRQSSKGGCYD